MTLFRLLILLLLGLTVVYLSLRGYFRASQREALRARWRETEDAGSEKGFVEAGLRPYDRSLKRRLIIGVYVVPLMAFALLVYVTNSY